MKPELRTAVLAIAFVVGVTANGAPSEGFAVLPQSLVQEALHWQVMGAGEGIPRETLLIVLAQPADERCVDRLSGSGYFIEGLGGQFVAVSAPITLFIDEEHGLDALGFVASSLPELGNWTNLALPVSHALAGDRTGSGESGAWIAQVAMTWRLGMSPVTPRYPVSCIERLLQGVRRIR